MLLFASQLDSEIPGDCFWSNITVWDVIDTTAMLYLCLDVSDSWSKVFGFLDMGRKTVLQAAAGTHSVHCARNHPMIVVYDVSSGVVPRCGDGINFLLTSQGFDCKVFKFRRLHTWRGITHHGPYLESEFVWDLIFDYPRSLISCRCPSAHRIRG